mgnify:CR=1 FL=1
MSVTILDIQPGKFFTRDGGATVSVRGTLFPWDSQAPCISLKTGQMYYLSFSTEVEPLEGTLSITSFKEE